MDAEPTRKLAVMLHADIVDSTRLVQKDESLAHQRIHGAFQRLSETTAAYGGVAHEIRGDALVAEFSRASDAVSAALAFQADNVDHNAGFNDDFCPEIRVGISLGEVIVADGTVTGAGVVLAQRLEQLAEPGGVVVQGSVSETVPDRMPFEFDGLGEQVLKGFDNPVRAFVARMGEGETVPAPEFAASETQSADKDGDELASLEPSDKPSIVVLPFRNATGDPGQDYVAEGIGYGLVTELSRNRLLSVRSAVSSDQLGTDRVVVGKDFAARYLLEGSVQKSGSRMRITVQVIDAATGETKWADRLDRTGDDVLALQDDIAATVAATLFGYQGQIAEFDRERAARKPTTSLTAYELVLRAQWHKHRYSREDNAKAIEYLQRAVDLDPDYADAYSWLSYVNSTETYFTSGDTSEYATRALKFAKQAVLLDRQSETAHMALGLAFRANRQYDRAIDAYDKALALNPNSADALIGKASALAYMGQPDDAIDCVENAKRLNPHYPDFYDWPLGIAYFQARRYEDAVTALNRLSEQNAHSIVWLAASYSRLQRSEEMVYSASRLLELEPDFRLSTTPTVTALANVADRDHLQDALRGLGLPE
jgi:adenylate cyclase